MIPGVPDWLLVVLALVLAVYIYGTWNHTYFDKLTIPYAKPLPLFGNMAPILFRTANTAEHIRSIYDKYKDHKIVGFFEFNTPLIMLKDPEIIKQIAVKDFDHFTDHRIAVSEKGDPLFSKNLFSLKGDRWKNMRSTLSPAFTSSKMKGMFLLMENCGIQMADYLAERCKASGMVSLEMKDFYTRYTNDVIATAAFGIHCDSLKDQENEFYLMGKDVTNFTGLRSFFFVLVALTSPKLLEKTGLTIFSKKASAFFRSLVHGTIATREKEGIIRPDMIHLMMQAKKGTLKGDATDDVTQTPDNQKKNTVLTDDDITAQALLFFLAGFDTTATVLSFMTLNMAINPEIQRRVQDEVDAMLRETDGKMTYEGIHQMKYVDMVISEALRLFPPAPTSDRKCVRPYTIAATDKTPSIKLKVGDGIWIPTFSIHRDPEYYPDPDRFDPERFNDENKKNINQFTYMPFGTGPRNCIGMRFAQMELKIAITSIMSRFNFEVIDKTPTKIRLQNKSFPMEPIGGFWVGIKPRTDVPLK